MTLATYFIGLKIENSSDDKVRKNWLITGLIFNLSILGVFKYYNFFIDSANVVIENIGIRLPFLEIILPIGISFITFELISYTIDIFRRDIRSPKAFIDLGLLVSFFPHLIAGPILKPREFIPQLQRDIVITWGNIEKGLQLFIIGLIKKILIADRLALFVDPVFASPNNYNSGTIWLAVIAYTLQIFCDFSGYTDMAIGSAKCLGFDIPRNFNMPYISKSITEFWRRWHISLSTWLREYLYIPLGGNRKGKARQYINLVIVMLLGGLWHGASWNFVLWGGFQGLGLAIHKYYVDNIRTPKEKDSFMYNFICWLLTMLFVCVGWVLFRTTNVSQSMIILSKLFFIGEIDGVAWYSTSILIIVPIVIISHIVGSKVKEPYYFKLNNFTGMFVLLFILLGILFLTPVYSSPFIYFQF
jgi:alginate O-acetyltransferase complex protein AlgI